MSDATNEAAQPRVPLGIDTRATRAKLGRAWDPLSEMDVRRAQEQWADGIVEIGRVFRDGGDYASRAAQHVRELYAFDVGPVLFKPTLAAQHQFRTTPEEALSYFIGGKIAEDRGFALRPWSQVRFGEQTIVVGGRSAFAMGNYYFTPVDGEEEQKVEFTFGYLRLAGGRLRINLHHSSLPYVPGE